MEKSSMLIINPQAGTGQYRNSVSGILDILCGDGYAVTVYMTQAPLHATELAKAYGGRYDLVVCCGGDGTLSETIAGMMALPVRPPLGYIPMGTANDVASTLRLPKNAEQAARIIVEGASIPFDVGLFQDQYFTYIAAFGAFTEVAYQTPRGNKQTLGHLAYVLEGVGQIGKIASHNMVVEYDGGRRVEGEYIFGSVSNTTSIAGLVKIKPDLVDLGDGAFEVILVKKPRNIIDLNHIFLSLLRQNYDPEIVTVFRTRAARFRSQEPVAWTRDGEAGGIHTQVELRTVQPGVEIIVPREKE